MCSWWKYFINTFWLFLQGVLRILNAGDDIYDDNMQSKQLYICIYLWKYSVKDIYWLSIKSIEKENNDSESLNKQRWNKYKILENRPKRLTKYNAGSFIKIRTGTLYLRIWQGTYQNYPMVNWFILWKHSIIVCRWKASSNWYGTGKWTWINSSKYWEQKMFGKGLVTLFQNKNTTR